MLLFPKTLGTKTFVEVTVGVWSVENDELVYRAQPNTPIVDMTMPSLKYVQPQLFTSFYLVDEETAMRPDIISHITMGNVTNIEKILKFNGISNPFTIDVGDLIFVPDALISNINMKASERRVEELKDIRNQYIDPEKASKIDPALETFGKRDKPKAADPSKTAPPLPPNFANIGEKEIEIKGGKIFFGPNISKNKEQCDEPISKSEFLAKLIKNRINK